MPRVTYVEHHGDAREVEVAVGHTVMEGAFKNGIPGIEAECGGACACATCHCYVDEAWLASFPPPKGRSAIRVQQNQNRLLKEEWSLQVARSQLASGFSDQARQDTLSKFFTKRNYTGMRHLA